MTHSEDAAGPPLAAETVATAPESHQPATESVTTADAPPPAAAAARRRRRWRMIAGTVVAVLGVIYVVNLVVTRGQIERGTLVGGVPVGGLSPDAAVRKLAAEFAPVQSPFPVSSHGDDVTIDPVAAGLRLDIPRSVAALGTRSANPLDMIVDLFVTHDEPVTAAVDTAALTAELQQIAATSDVTAVEGSVTLAGGAPTVVLPVSGQQLILADAVRLVSDHWLSGQPMSVRGLTLPVTTVPVRASATGIAAADAELRTLLSGPLTVVAGDTTFTVGADALAALTTVRPDSGDGFTVAVDGIGLAAKFADQLASAERAPVDATVSIVDNGPVVTPAVSGRTLDRAATADALRPALTSPERTLTAVYVDKPPAVSTETVQQYGIKEMISEFVTHGFASDSGLNIKQVAAKVQGAVVKPGETFSLNGYTGPRTAAQGYVEAGIIENGVPGRAVGGGISQFATTLYNASYFAAMADVAHTNHSYYISRYPMGREATVFQNPDGSSVIDLKFKNTSATAVLIQTIWTPADITVRFWGTKTVVVQSVIGQPYNPTPAPTRTIPFGQKCTPTAGAGGFAVDVDTIIRDLAGNEVSRSTMTTHYTGQVKVTCAPPPAAQTTPSTPSSPSTPAVPAAPTT
jgi:vancomycin resistance protein YoaR